MTELDEEIDIDGEESDENVVVNKLEKVWHDHQPLFASDTEPLDPDWTNQYPLAFEGHHHPSPSSHSVWDSLSHSEDHHHHHSSGGHLSLFHHRKRSLSTHSSEGDTAPAPPLMLASSPPNHLGGSSMHHHHSMHNNNNHHLNNNNNNNNHHGNHSHSSSNKKAAISKEKIKSESNGNIEHHHHSNHVSKHTSSSQNLPSHNTPWTPREQELFEEGIQTFGVGKWKDISSLISTRNALQVKNHARQYLKKKGIVKEPKKEKSSKKEKKLKSEKKNIVDSISSTTISVSAADEDDGDIDIGEEDVVAYPPTETDIGNTIIHDALPTTPSHIQMNNFSLPSSPLHQLNHHNQNEVGEHDLGIFDDEFHNHIHPEFSIPTEEKEMEPESILPEEEQYNFEFFTGNNVKTPGRYLKIRNGIIEAWKKIKPNYLSKTAVRHTLKDCGDVNAIGRVHDFLESYGAINFGIEKPNRTKGRTVERTSLRTTSGEEINYLNQLEYKGDPFSYKFEVGKRRRKVRTKEGNWVSEDDLQRLENRTLDHTELQNMNEKDLMHSSSHQHSHRWKKRDHSSIDHSLHSDPFYLIEPSKFDTSTRGLEPIPQPFRVQISSNVTIMMDLHSHLVSTEVMGLLGGHFSANENGKLLDIQIAIPCDSKSTEVQCEMDPFSQVEAREFLEEQQMEVLGWYHSHVTFSPHPSVRDIDTQSTWQVVYAKENHGEPFVGAIICPYDPSLPSTASAIKWFWVRRGEYGELGIPMDVVVSEHQGKLPEQLIDMMGRVIEKYRQIPSKIDFEGSWPMNLGHSEKEKDITKLEKLKESLGCRLLQSPQRDRVLEFVQSNLRETW
eukprot:TRINITY_DN2533_c0_g1_i1.p1 TRINITY_DN2533_c0_g1~~TRINITY_DN2533_c0_g1_i1.p1  ORF type:complete len:838 (-),score=276.73 TRINITY_DN2533_c0_g1_i1:71-2584(-)